MRRFLIGCMIFLQTCMIYAQFSVGPKIGVTISKFPNYFNATPVVGYKIGATVEYLFPQYNFYIKSGISVTQKGMHGMEVDINGVEPVTAKQYMNVKMTYLDIPLSIGYSLLLKDHLYLKMDAGMYYAHGIGSNGHLILSDFSEGLYRPFNDNYMSVPAYTGSIPSFKRKDYGFTFGLSLAVYKFQIGASYDHGLPSIHDNFPSFEEYNPKNRSFAIIIGWMF